MGHSMRVALAALALLATYGLGLSAQLCTVFVRPGSPLGVMLMR